MKGSFLMEGNFTMELSAAMPPFFGSISKEGKVLIAVSHKLRIATVGRSFPLREINLKVGTITA